MAQRNERLIDRVYGLIHELEDEDRRDDYTPDPDDFTEGVRSGVRAKRHDVLWHLRRIVRPGGSR